MNEPVSPVTVAPPAANYALGVRTTGAATWLHTSGIVGTRPDGTIAPGIGDQAAEVWRSIGALLTDAGLAVSDIVSYTTYAIAGENLGAVMAARDEFLQGHRACSTLIPVPALAREEWKVEIAIVAAR